MEIIKIDIIEGYNLCLSEGLNPLLDPRFNLDHDLRVSIQNKLFGGSPLGQKNVAAGNVKFYKWVWKHKEHECEECGLPLENYWSGFVSHILGRKPHPDKRWDIRNCNILCGIHHKQWETEPESMKIWTKNQNTIKKLKSEYT